MNASFFPESGFVGRGKGPRREAPRDWIVWHFTHIDNLSSVVDAGRLLPDSAVTAATNVANDEVKERRRHKKVDPHTSYPTSMVSDHVPFYIAAKSPMLYVVCRGHGHYTGGAGPLVNLGICLGDIIDAGLTWCASDGNAAASFTQFSSDLANLGNFVDFDLLCQRDWYNTAEDSDRKSRRSAEILVHGAVPIELVSYVCCSDEDTSAAAATLLDSVGGVRNYIVEQKMYY
ncbi:MULTISPECIES: type II toxin-antitoxin system toxin DNA ADP-ribosyl transferase DarT [Mycobacteriaceae]|uniref:DarT domain-containing protein n=1 Tax=Mycolicibacterium neoaurum VKM Ac-1815D TaxID=700508 RepID=V5X8U0_MYCNE|nr:MULTISPECIES: DUF4433 domain-containing protein [Mycobacteriaceae]AHC23834.1 hypothetical protein D174_04150 [Mycolicibacterium neoaurum VKM Ac-1815D]AMO04499.1 hypothetical protein MyAD_04065 [Mycolicibacterium neoaurum]AXK77213.1 DUF4433 domain-containing protein [Mycolicibacterium neoaurum]KJQ48522.1 hypothetical protein TS71_20645 [Mycolicibacterium neoaurum]KUM06908.1 hypothetical protein AVZ31_18815 [Mycolicibacterium neoaurum]